MAAQSMAQRGSARVIVGVDTHKDVHVASAKDELGRALGQMTITASAKGYRALLSWSRRLGQVQAFGVEGTGCYGAGLTRYLRREGQLVIEVIRPSRSARRLEASPIQPTPTRLPRPCSPERQAVPPSRATGPWR
jgi:transposase